MRGSPRLWSSISGIAILLLLVLALPGKPVFAADNQVVLIFGGDVEWSLNARPPTVRYRIADPTPYGKIVYGRRDVRDLRDFTQLTYRARPVGFRTLSALPAGTGLGASPAPARASPRGRRGDRDARLRRHCS